MHRQIIAAAGILVAVTLPLGAYAQETGTTPETSSEQTGQGPEYTLPEGGEIEVTVDLDAIANAEAGARWKEISTDLENALAERLVDSAALAERPRTSIMIDIDEVALATLLESAAGVADSTLVGTVSVTHPVENPVFDSYVLTVTFANAAPTYVPQGTDMATVTADSDVFYQTMINAFADHVAERINNS